MPDGPGRPRRYCRQSCRQRDYEARRRAAELGLGEHELVITRAELQDMQDRLFVLACTIDDAERDLAQPEAKRVAELRRILAYVAAAAREAVQPVADAVP